MPELPEVETIRRDLVKSIVGLTIIDIDLRLPKLIRGYSAEEFVRRLKGAKVLEAGRRAKMLILKTSAGELLIHLKMSGRLIYCPAACLEEKHTHVIFFMDNGSELRFVDMRKFGFFRLVADSELSTIPELANLGPEPLDISLSEFTRLINKKKTSKRSIKALLMDQSFVAGIGNIYADEVLFAAGVMPSRPVLSMTEGETAAIHHQIRTVLSLAVKNRGTSFSQYVDASGQTGRHQEQLKVYRQTGKSCPRCGKPIERIKLGGRGTHFCSDCQR